MTKLELQLRPKSRYGLVLFWCAALFALLCRPVCHVAPTVAGLRQLNASLKSTLTATTLS